MMPTISQEEAIARARRYAEEHGHPFYPPRPAMCTWSDGRSTPATPTSAPA
ncbi:MAG: hypothetical protein INR71_04200 [Terriglobus roseus]|nr:hypothetical protein [Terriglobus roseus]